MRSASELAGPAGVSPVLFRASFGQAEARLTAWRCCQGGIFMFEFPHGRLLPRIPADPGVMAAMKMVGCDAVGITLAALIQV